jgi:hypothetical protein
MNTFSLMQSGVRLIGLFSVVRGAVTLPSDFMRFSWNSKIYVSSQSEGLHYRLWAFSYPTESILWILVGILLV